MRKRVVSKKKNRGFFFTQVVSLSVVISIFDIVKLFGVCPVIFPFKEKGFLRKFLCFLCGCASAVLAKISSPLYREFFQHGPCGF